MVRDLTTPSRTMSRQRIPSAIFAIALSACVVEPELLNSERIKERFGSYGIDVLASSDRLRRSSLHSIEGGEKICRTYAVVRFDETNAMEISKEHAQILEGGSIGATFKTNGWKVYKETRFVGDLEIGANASHLRQLMDLNGTGQLAMHVYRLLLKKGAQTIDYATIVEVHHPDYLSSDDVARLYVVDEPARLDRAELSAMSQLVMSSH